MKNNNAINLRYVRTLTISKYNFNVLGVVYLLAVRVCVCVCVCVCACVCACMHVCYNGWGSLDCIPLQHALWYIKNIF